MQTAQSHSPGCPACRECGSYCSMYAMLSRAMTIEKLNIYRDGVALTLRSMWLQGARYDINHNSPWLTWPETLLPSEVHFRCSWTTWCHRTTCRRPSPESRLRCEPIHSGTWCKRQPKATREELKLSVHFAVVQVY